MPHPLVGKLASIRRRVWTLVMLQGLSRVTAVLVGLIVILALADYLLRPQFHAVRLLASFSVLAIFLWTSYRNLYRPATRVPSDVVMARRIEGRYPRLGNRFSSAVEFLRQKENDPTAGSAAMRRAVIAQSAQEVDSLDPAEVIAFRPAIGSVAMAAATCLLACGLVVLEPASARIALARLVHPLQPVAWPRKHHLVLNKAPVRLATGQCFQVEVVDRNGRLPKRVRIHYRFAADGHEQEQIEPMRLHHGLMIARKEHVRRPFAYRVEGGDDNTMPWHPLEVVPPPRVASLRITLYPPSYTGWAPIESGPRIEALVGTRAEIQGTATKPLRRATLNREPGSLIEARLSADGQQFTVPAGALTIDESAAYWLALEAFDGTQGDQRRWQVRAVRDMPPRVSIERPATDLYVTPVANVDLQVLVQDDLAIRDVTLVATRSDRTQGERLDIPLYAGKRRPFSPAEKSGPMRTAADRRATHAADRRQLEHVWDLRPLDLVPGTQILFHVRASDYRLQAGQSSPPGRIHVVTTEEFDQRVAQRQRRLLDDLKQVLSLEREIHGHTLAMRQRLRQANEVVQEDVDRLQAVELNQRQAKRLLAEKKRGVAARAACLLAELTGSRLDRPKTKQRLRALALQVADLVAHQLPAALRTLTAARKEADLQRIAADHRAKPAAIAASLAAAAQHQQEAIDALERISGDLSEWLGYVRFQREIAQLRRAQLELASDSSVLARKTLMYQPKELPEEQRGALADVAGRQLDLAQRLARIEEAMLVAGAALRRRNPNAAAALTAAAQMARRLTISGRMREAGHDLGRNRVGRAAAKQARIAEDLTQLLDRLSRREQNGNAWRELSAALHNFAGRQQSLLDQTVRLAKAHGQTGKWTGQLLDTLQRLAQREQSLADETGRQSEALRQSRVFQVALQQTAHEMTRGAQLLTRRQADVVTQQTLADAHARLIWMIKALRIELEPARTAASPPTGGQTGAGRRPAASRLRVAELKLLRTMQQEINHEARRLAETFAHAKLNADQRRAIEALAARQGELADLTVDLLPSAAANNHGKPTP